MDYPTFYNEMTEHYYRGYAYHTMKDPDNDATSGNHHVINATYHVVSSKLEAYSFNEIALARDFVQSLKFIRATEVEPGLYNRHVKKIGDSQTHDDYIGIAASSKLLKLPYSKHIVDYGDKRRYGLKWYYDNLKRDKFNFDSWHGKWPGLAGVFKRSAGKNVNVLDRVGYCAMLLADVYFTKDRTNTSGKILIWLKNSVMKGEGRMVNWCIGKWEAYIKEAYPSGYMGEVLGIYHGVEHPFSRAMWRKM